ncbi:MAG: hypothetical protein EZS28_012050 [Streblomastix strix]|uniref:Uncharacterized protein n=1 Tax=Streblomastix strix TaxID=222440 RepID=A0A5J4WBT8_9EUKA|nr:MAG: hypothetical protein EZS28_012050 [Streblomastix strix]
MKKDDARALLKSYSFVRGYYLLNTDIQNLPDSANGDFSFSAESGTVWKYDQNQYNSGDIVPDQVTPARVANPQSDGIVTAGISTEYSRGDHVHPLNITTTIPPSDSASGSVGTTNYYARNDHSHPINITTTIPPHDSASGSVGTTNYYARNDHSHPINIETNASNIPIVNGVDANGTSAFYARQDHIYPQQLIYDRNVTVTKFIKAGGKATEVLCANEDTLNGVVDIESNQTITGIRIAKATNEQCQIFFCVDPNEHIGFIEGQWTVGIMLGEGSIAQQYSICQSSDYATANRGLCGNPQSTTGALTDQWSMVNTPTGELRIGVNIQINQNQGLMVSADGNTLNFNGKINSGYTQINPTVTEYDDGLRISRTVENTGGSSIFLGCSRESNVGTIDNCWKIFIPPSSYVNNPLGLNISLSADSGDNPRGLQISADGNTLTFNEQVL